MKKYYLLIVAVCIANTLLAQIDPVLLRRTPKDTSGTQMNIDAVYNQPFLQMGKLPVAVGGYVEANYQYLKKELEKDKKKLQRSYEQKLLDMFNENSRELERLMREWKEERSDNNKFDALRNYIDTKREELETQIEKQDAEVNEDNEGVIRSHRCACSVKLGLDSHGSLRWS